MLGAWTILWDAFGDAGLPEQLLSDNAFSTMGTSRPAGISWFDARLIRLGIRPSHGRAYHPQTQGKVERMHGSSVRELINFNARRDSPEHFRQDCNRWRSTYNNIRPHEALDDQTPASRWTPTPTQPNAPKRALERRVLRSSHLALSPAARRAVRKHKVAPGALTLLLHTPRLGSPLLVFSARGRSLEVQATRMWMTRKTLIALHALPARGRPASLRLRPVSNGSTDVRARHGGMLGPQAVAIAKRYLGIPYVWGGATPTGGFDCSGLTMYVYRQLGISLDHYAAWQFLEGERIPPEQLQPGDLVFFHPQADGPGHVGIYVGDGKMLHAPHTGDVVRISSIQGRSGYLGAVRPY